MKTNSKTIPARAAFFNADLEFSQNKPTDKTAKIKILGRTGDAIDHWFFGKVVHDMSGMKLHKNKLTIDYNHNADEIVGYLNKFDIETGDLISSGVLTPFKEGDRASELIFKMKEGVPYEASINFSDETVLEEIEEDEEVEVNNRSFTGPLTVIREWGLRNIAVCPLGADKNTSSELFSDSKETVEVKYLIGDKKMKTELTVEEEVVETATVETEVDKEVTETETETETELTEEVPVDETVEEVAETEATEETVEEGDSVEDEKEDEKEFSIDRKEFIAMKEEFGKELAVDYFTQGVSLSVAREKHYSHLKEENAKLTESVKVLKSELSKLSEEDSPEVEFIAEDNNQDPRYKELSATIGSNLAKFITGRPR